MCASSTISRSFWASIYCLHSYKDYPLLYQNLVIWLKFLAASFSIIGFLILVVPLHLKQCDLTSGPPHYPSTTQTKWLYRVSFLQNIFLHFFFRTKPHYADFAPFCAAAHLPHHKLLLTDLKSGSARQNCTTVRRGFGRGGWVFCLFVCLKITAFLDITSHLVLHTHDYFAFASQRHGRAGQ